MSETYRHVLRPAIFGAKRRSAVFVEIRLIKKENPADTTVSARQCRHLAIKFEVGHRSCDRSSNLCSHPAKALELRK